MVEGCPGAGGIHGRGVPGHRGVLISVPRPTGPRPALPAPGAQSSLPPAHHHLYLPPRYAFEPLLPSLSTFRPLSSTSPGHVFRRWAAQAPAKRAVVAPTATRSWRCREPATSVARSLLRLTPVQTTARQSLWTATPLFSPLLSADMFGTGVVAALSIVECTSWRSTSTAFPIVSQSIYSNSSWESI